MPHQPLFPGLVFDEYDHPAEIAYVGEEPCYVVNDAGFRRHIPSEQVDLQILDAMKAQINGNEDTLTTQTAKMLGQDDIFSRALILNQLKNLDKQFELLLNSGIPEEGRAYLGMMGFKVTIDVHGTVLGIEQPGIASPDGDE